MRRITIFLVISLIVGILVTGQQPISEIEKLNASPIRQQENQYITELTHRDPLSIIGNDELASIALTESWTGNGSASNPFIFEGYSFFSEGECLSVSNTTDYFTIQNCSFEWDNINEYSQGITLVNVENILVTNCTFNLQKCGVKILDSNNCIVRNITCTNGNYCGVDLWTCINILIEENTMVGVRYGISIHDTSSLCQIHNNSLTNSCLYFRGDKPSHYIHNVTGNTVNNLPFGYYYNISDTSIDLNGYGCVLFANCSNIIAGNGVFLNASIGVTLAFCNDSTLFNVENSYGRYGVYMNYCTNCSLKNSTLTDSNYSVIILYSDNCRVLNNSLNPTVGYGCYIFDSQEIEISRNEIFSDYCHYGIFVDLCNSSIFVNNTISGFDTGIDFDWTRNCNVTQNTITNNEYGYRSLESEYNYVFDNSISFNIEGSISISSAEGDEFAFNILDDNRRGVHIDLSANCTFLNNTISNSFYTGMYVHFSSECIIINNTVTNNGDIGIDLHSTVSDFEIYRNIIGWNDNGNARDSGDSNMWDDGISRGNQWSDYTTPPYYEIPGAAGSYDRYPSVIEDVHAPLLIVDHSPTTPTSEEIVTITAQIHEVTGLSEVVLFYSIDNGVTWNNFTMEQDAIEWVGYIPAYTEDTLVLYIVNATDILGHSALSVVRSYTVAAVVTTPTTTTDVSSTISTTTSDDTGSTLTSTDANGDVILFVGIGTASGIIVILIFEFLKRRNMSDKQIT